MKPDYGALSEREEQVLLLSTKGLTDKEIAKKLNLSIATVNTYWVRIRTKLGGANRAELVASALQKNNEQTLTMKELENQRLISEIVRRADAEKALRESQERLQSILDGTPVLISLKDQLGRYTMVNAGLEHLLEKDRRDIISKRDVDLFPHEIAEQSRANDRAVLESGKPSEVEEVLPTVEGPRIFSCARFPLANEEGQRYAVCNFARDITERKRTEQRLAAQYAVTAVLAESDSLEAATEPLGKALCSTQGFDYAGLWMVEPKTEELRWAGGWHADRLGGSDFIESTKSLAMVRGQGLPGRAWEMGKPVIIDQVRTDGNLPRKDVAIKAKLGAGVAFPIRLKNEVLGVIECFAASIQDNSEEFIQTIDAISSQIAQFIERKQAEDKLRQQNEDLREAMEKLHSFEVEMWRQNVKLAEAHRAAEQERQRYLDLFERAPDGYLETSFAGEIKEANAAAGKLLNVGREALLGSKISEWVSEASRKDFKKRLDQMTAGNEPAEWEVVLQPKGMSLVDVAVSVSPVKYGDTESLRWSFRDITRRKWAENELVVANETLERRVRTRTIELEETNTRLQEEIGERKRAEEDLFDTFRFSSSVIESSQDGIVAFDRECRYTVWNKIMEDMSGMPKDQVLGRYAFDLFPFLVDTGEDECFHRALRGERVKSETRPYTIVSSGKRGYFEGQYAPLRNEKGDIIGGLGLIREVTAKVKQD